ncbi:hypothetical protein psal_cds_120 [Pandoravirus salinus]|uniref:Uncharacterized protein n=1 Tax=Pandoravirus salinus TaxID=1349410 RepID=S4VT04_9VIRU|nr:hypothetical protein psal_cds_120 [Pandoravirus salinus]AGO83569.1 hypothetical protein psal_cds_120 [Pandoravirus salinus]
MGQATSTTDSNDTTTTGMATAVTFPIPSGDQTDNKSGAEVMPPAVVPADTAEGDAALASAHNERKARIEDICRRLEPTTGSPPDPNTTVVPSGDRLPVASQADLDAALASIAEPTAVTALMIGFSHKRPIANASLLDKYDMIPDGTAAAVYADHAANAYRLAGLSAFTALKRIDITTDDGCPHPIFVSIPRAVWSALDAVDGDWTKFVIVD